MPVLTDDMVSKTIRGSDFAFSHTKIDRLGADRYCLATLVLDVTGSVCGYETEIEGALKTVASACSDAGLNPTADNTMLRVVLFSSRLGIQEVHGFKLVQDIEAGQYDGIIRTGGMTPLYDAAYSAIQATVDFGRDLVQDGYVVNGICVVVTDGENNCGKMGRPSVKKAIEEATRGEVLESFRPVLVGLNVDPQSGSNYWLDLFRQEAGFDQYETVKNLTADSAAKLAGWIHRSISAQSQSVGTGGPSQSLALS